MLLLSFGLVTTLASCAPSLSSPGPEALSSPAPVSSNKSLDYVVMNAKDISLPDRRRFEISIAAPEASTFESRGQTVVAACKSLLARYNALVVRVWLEPNENTRGIGFVLAMATYSPDGKGMSGYESVVVWDNVNSTDYQLSRKALKMTRDSKLSEISSEQARVIGSRRPYSP